MAREIRNDKLNLSDEKLSTLKQFRENVSDVLSEEQDDYYLIKWLRARGFNLKKSEEMLRKSAVWRKRWGADSILTQWQCPEVVHKYDIGGRCGYDKEGCPIWIYKSACLDMKGMSLAARRADMIKEYIRKMEFTHEEFKELSNKHGRRVHQAVLINDLEGFTLKHLFQPGMDVILKIMALIEANYPETLKTGYVINAPTIFPVIFKLCKPFMSEDTKNKIKILGSNWKEELLEVIPADQLPVHWGGTRLDPVTGDNYCSSIVKMGGVIPTSYYLKPSDLVDESKVKTLLVESGQTISLESKVDKDNIVIRYTFWTDGYDVKFGIYYKERESQSDKDLKELRRNAKVNCHQVPEDGTVDCPKAGVYVFQFDNSYSWFHSKKISYVIEVLDPEVMSKDTEHTCTESSEVHLHLDSGHAASGAPHTGNGSVCVEGGQGSCVKHNGVVTKL